MKKTKMFQNDLLKKYDEQEDTKVKIKLPDKSLIKEDNNSPEEYNFTFNQKLIGSEEENAIQFNELKLRNSKSPNYINNCNENKCIPYAKAIEYLKKVNENKNPYEKMMLIASISSEITSCVNDCWKGLDKIITKSLLNIDADELMSIFIYIIIKSQISELPVHTKIIKEFTTCVTKNTMIGYYFVTVDASILYILDIKDKFLLKDSKEVIRSSFLPDKKSFLMNEVM